MSEVAELIMIEAMAGPTVRRTRMKSRGSNYNSGSLIFVQWKICLLKSYTEKVLPSLDQIRVAVLHALLDAFKAVQYLPQNRFTLIEGTFGISTIVVWASHVLDLTVCVAGDKSTIRMSDGFEAVFADTHSCGEVRASSLNETKDVYFQVINPDEDLPLDPPYQYPVLGYGGRALVIQDFHRGIIEGIANANVTSCLSLVQKKSERACHGDADRREKNRCPSAQRVVAVAVGKRIFRNDDDALETLNLDNEQPCLATSIREFHMLPDSLAPQLQVHDNGPLLKSMSLV